MLRMMVVDDEKIIRDGIMQDINWEEYGVTLCQPASNGREAIDLIETEKPQIILLDINMPFMDGLAMASWLREHHPEIRIIFLTGYDEFSYAKKALQLKADGYILKYESHEELIKEVKRVELELDEEYQQFREKENSIRLLRDEFFSNLIMGAVPENRIDEKLSQLSLELPCRYYVIALINVAGKNDYRLQDKPNFNEIYLFAIMNICEEVAGRYHSDYYCGSYDGQVYLLLGFQEADREKNRIQTEKILEEAVAHLEKHLKAEVHAGVSPQYTGLEHTDANYNMAYVAVGSKNHFPSKKILMAADLPSSMVIKNSLIHEIEAYIHKNYARCGLSLSDLAEEIHLSSSHLCRIIKNSKDTNFMTWLSEVRVREAMKLIRTTDDKIYEICEKVGYNNPQYFSVVFKKYAGCSPKEYKEQAE